MSAETFAGEGTTVEEAILAGCRAAGLDRDLVMIEVVSEGGAAAPGERISGATARVLVQPIPAEGLLGRRNLETLLKLMDIEAEVHVRPVRPPATDAGERTETVPLLLSVEGADLGILIGWRGESLRALQTVLNLMLGESGLAPGAPRLIVDVAGYRQRREQTVAQMALRMAAGVTRSGRAVTLEPMQPYERRAVHLALADDPSVSTESTGMAAERRVIIRPAGEAGP
ncbi:MAG TPA: R3H domain-containing nucleic acid-binding protein [Candidatus Dormibacteraeota bacterium]|nr:R3H domain-containing nucleic acid-binding protein [Candidatus Dormibacteraeota bacterium]